MAQLTDLTICPTFDQAKRNKQNLEKMNSKKWIQEKIPGMSYQKHLDPLWCCWLVFVCLLNGWMDFPSGRKRHVVDGVHTSCDWSFLLSNEICKKTGGKKDKSTYKWKHNNVPIWLEQSLFTTWFYQFWILHPDCFCNNLKKVGYFFLIWFWNLC